MKPCQREHQKKTCFAFSDPKTYPARPPEKHLEVKNISVKLLNAFYCASREPPHRRTAWRIFRFFLFTAVAASAKLLHWLMIYPIKWNETA